MALHKRACVCYYSVMQLSVMCTVLVSSDCVIRHVKLYNIPHGFFVTSYQN